MCVSTYWELVFKDIVRKVSKYFNTLLLYFYNYFYYNHSIVYDEPTVSSILKYLKPNNVR